MDSNDFKILEKKSTKIGEEMLQLMEELFPICRSITGNGVRQTLEIIKKYVCLETHEIPSGTKVYDWIIPKEWNIQDAYIIDPNGRKIIDFKKSNLHVLNYSTPINQKMPLSELKKHIHTIPEKPNLVPYVTSYYSENWGFCMSHNQFLELEEGEYNVVIDSKLDNGHLTYGEYMIPGKSKNEILLSCYVCHPSMCNDNLSGVVLLTMLAKYMQNFQNNYSIRFLFIPETIGAITWLHINESHISKIKHGLIATCLGDSGSLTYKRTRNGNEEIDKTVENILKKTGTKFRVLDFFPWGSDERQFCSPGFNLPVGSLFRSIYGSNEFPEYHTSGDNLNFMNVKSLTESFITYLLILFELENNFHLQLQNNKSDISKNFKNQSENKISDKYLNLNPKCEPQLGKRGIYHKIGGQESTMKQRKIEFAIFWILNLSDGNNTIQDIAKRSGISLEDLQTSIKILINSKLLQKIEK
ncbi:aminopeptidase domain-containing protein [Candidatus Nitrosarchaeum limnium SFB1]|jgi:aminopeptidase-like protein|uniref:Aminopeptidase domain-containing protein n=1 Tax=Candidatus Nitrosarchaeum limnium SFB1 TaxID=886738 RepID=F3KMX2_9ARCH|nr:aminopeptidase domain-containing protein [Candidatus Nitrosarchaeum limnium SFB1]